MNIMDDKNVERWYDDREEVLTFARRLADAGAFSAPTNEETLDNVFYYFEKPWKWNEEHTIWKEYGRIRLAGDP
jgi:hypothetical protein